jgi:hypothetical protein
MTPPNVILGLAVQELATKLAYVHARRVRVANALASLDKLAGASELGTQQLGGSPGFDPMKRPPPPKLGKPIPTPSSSSTTKSADTACEGKPKRGIEPELTEKLRQDAEAQTPMADGDVAAKVAVSKDWLRRGIEAPRRALDEALEVGSIGRAGPGASDIAALRGRLADLGDRLAGSQHPLAQYAQGIADTEGAVLRGMHRDLVNPRVGWRL